MEVRWLKTLLCVLLSVCSSLRAHPIDHDDHENVWEFTWWDVRAQTPVALCSLSPPPPLSSPLLQLYSSTRSKSLRLDHQAGSGGQGLASVLFPGGSPFSGGGWVRLALNLEAGHVSLFVDCREAVVIQRDKEERVKLQLPPDLVITLASTQGDMESKFTVSKHTHIHIFTRTHMQGYVQTAEISTRAYQRRPWHCDNIT
ncbi:unnamed protein product, partial [Coregonus sp. 'balchen']